MSTSTLESAKNASSACELWKVSRSTPPAAPDVLSAGSFAGAADSAVRRSAQNPTTAGTNAPAVTPTIAPRLSGATSSATSPNASRPTPMPR